MSKKVLFAVIKRQGIAPLGGFLSPSMNFTMPVVIGDIEIRHLRDVTQIWVKPSRGKRVVVACGGTILLGDVPQDSASAPFPRNG